ncbi:MAG: transposase [Actinobacteria bacterium]|nr:transposase [Actinomycetota bacterium]MBU1944743.1 transposase [Actinomycetota bacterium]MBU2688424.1 transposase [Actinomycetota bacterium]
MSYPERPQFPGAIYHIMSRGNGKKDIYLSERDRRRFLSFLKEVTEEKRWLVLSYCLMGHHYHLLLETPEPNLAIGMQKLNGLYSTWFNHVHQHVGHVMQGRYRSRVVDEDGYFMWLTKYIALNPVRSGFVDSPEKWPWSSYAWMVGKETEHPLLSPARVLNTFGSGRAEAAVEYARYVTEGIEESLEIAEERRLTLEQLLKCEGGNSPADERLWRAYYVHHFGIVDIAAASGVSRSAVSRIIRRYPQRKYYL